MLAVAGVNVSQVRPRIDGIDHWAVLTAGVAGDGGGPTRIGAPSTPLRDHVPVNIVANGTDYTALVFADGGDSSGDRATLMKLLVGSPLGPFNRMPQVGGWFRGGTYPPIELPPARESEPLLFNLSADPQERSPLPLEAYARQYRRGLALLAGYRGSSRYQEPQANRPHLAGMPALHEGVWSPWLRHGEEGHAAAEPGALVPLSESQLDELAYL